MDRCFHSLPERGVRRRSGGADFVLFGPVYFTPSKSAYGKPQGIEPLREVVEKISIPVYAIGGIKPEHIGAVKRAGARGVALISAVMAAAEPREAAREILRRLKE